MPTLDQAALTSTAISNAELDVVTGGFLTTTVDLSRIHSKGRGGEHQALEKSRGTHGENVT